MRVLGSAYPYPHPSCLLVHPSSLFQLGGFNPTYCFFHVFPSVYTYLCIHTYQLCNKYVTCIVAKHDVDIKYMVWCAVQNFICSCTYYTLVCTQLLTISHMIMHRHCLPQTTDRTRMHTSLFSILASVISPSSHLNYLYRSRRLVEHVGEMRFSCQSVGSPHLKMICNFM